MADLTLDGVYTAVTDPRVQARDTDAIAAALDTGDLAGVEAMVQSMLVSGFLTETMSGLGAGPNRPATAGTPRSPAAPTRPRPVASGRPDAVQPMPDKLGIAARIQCGPGEVPAGSGSVGDDECGLACAAALSTRYGPQVRVGVPILDEHKRWWRGAARGATVVLDSDGVEKFAAAVEQVIAAGKASQPATNAMMHRQEQLWKQLEQLQAQLFPDPEVAEAYRRADSRLDSDAEAQIRRLADMGRARSYLDPALQPAYDELERQWQAASGRAQQWAIREQQAVLVTGLPVEQVRDFYHLDVGVVNRRDPQDEARYRRYLATPGNVLAGSRSRLLRNRWFDYALIHHEQQDVLIARQSHLDRLQEQAVPLDGAGAELHDQVLAELASLEERLEPILGKTVASGEVAGEWGDLIIECVQREDERGLNYWVDVRPRDADEDWTSGDNSQSWSPKPAQLRRLAALLRDLRDGAVTPDDRLPPSGVVPF